MSRVLCVIPARFGSSRFPGKPLAMLWGKPLVQHVWERARAVSGVHEIVVATDDARIAGVAGGFGANVEMTSPDHPSGTDRVAEVALRRPAAEVIVNVQGDEPELDAEAVTRMIGELASDPALRMVTLAHAEHDPAVLGPPDVVKVVVDAEGFALYFSRDLAVASTKGGTILRHVGVYGFRRDFLLEFAAWPPSTLEVAERLEQLRALQRGVRIKVALGSRSAGVDTPQELAILERRGPGRG